MQNQAPPMLTGFLWYDTNPGTAFSSKLLEADEQYRSKHGRCIEICLINPDMAKQHGIPDDGETFTVNGHDITVRIYKPVLPKHLWVGLEDGKD